MASLTHVCMWSDNGRKRITAEQATQLPLAETTFARRRLFYVQVFGFFPVVLVTDLFGSEYALDESKYATKQKMLLLKSTLDGKIIISNDYVVE